jgi:hypothetical protein
MSTYAGQWARHFCTFALDSKNTAEKEVTAVTPCYQYACGESERLS